MCTDLFQVHRLHYFIQSFHYSSHLFCQLKQNAHTHSMIIKLQFMYKSKHNHVSTVSISSLSHLFGHHGCLYSIGHCINPSCHAEVVEPLVLLPYSILGINPRPLHVTLLQCLLYLGLLLFLVFLTLLCCPLHLLGGELDSSTRRKS